MSKSKYSQEERKRSSKAVSVFTNNGQVSVQMRKSVILSSGMSLQPRPEYKPKNTKAPEQF